MSSMQKTTLDSWLRRKYVYETYVYCNTLPREVPEGITLDETTAEAGGMYKYRFIVPDERLVNELTARLEVANITYTSRIGDKASTQQKLLNNPYTSFTMQMAWIIVIGIIAIIILSGLPQRIWEKYSAIEEEPEGKKKRAAVEQVEYRQLPG